MSEPRASGYFRTSYDVKGRDVSVQDESLKAAVAGAILRHQHRLVQISGFNILSHSPLISRFNVVLQQRSVVLEQSKNKLKMRLAALDPKNDAKDQVITDVHDAVADTDQLSTAFDAYAKAVTGTHEGQTQSDLASATLREQLIQHTDTRYLLHVSVASSGGMWWTKSSLLRFLRELFKPGEIVYGGGLAVAYVLAKATGEIIAADTVIGLSQMPYYLPAKEPLHVQRLLNFADGPDSLSG